MPPPEYIEKDPQINNHAERILATALQGIREQTENRVKRVISTVLDDNVIAAETQGAVIRQAAICGKVIKAVLALIGESPDRVNLLSIGDTELPEFARPTIAAFDKRAHEYVQTSIADGETGYDFVARGSEEARRATIQNFDRHYGFSQYPGLTEALARNMCLENGGMNGLAHIAQGLVLRARKARAIPRFVHPDNSFGTWHEITRAESDDGRTAKVYRLGTRQEDSLHLTPEQVINFYRRHPAHPKTRTSWCITPVGNPSGTRIKPQQLKETCEAIIQHDPEAIILLDCVYVRISILEKARELMTAVLENPAVRSRIIFLESYSKTHAMCGFRLGMFFAENDEVFRPPQNRTMVYTAGLSKHTDNLIRAIGEATPEQNTMIDRLHEFWAKEREGLYHYLIASRRFSHLFDANQSHVDPAELKEPISLYLFLKLKPGVNERQVLLETGCHGVLTEMDSGMYLRLAVGKLVTPTYAKYAPQ